MKRILLLLIVLMGLFVSGCAGRGPVGSWCGPLPEKAAVSAIAADAVHCLSGLYPPGHTTLHLIPAKAADNDFAAAFESGLRARGFTLAATDADALSVAYTLDALDEKAAWYLQLRLSDGKAIARAYTASGQPEAGQSRTEVEFRRSAFGKAVDKAGQKARQAWDTGVNALTE
mgnify:CR=1 FL=1